MDGRRDQLDVLDYAKPQRRPGRSLSSLLLTLVFGAFFVLATLFAVRMVIALLSAK